jgi:recombination protein RecR
MSHYPQPIRKLIQRLARLPGVGEKTAERLALHLLYADELEVQELARSLLEVKQKVGLCSRCFALSDGALCAICGNPGRDASRVCVVEQPGDLAAVEKSGAFNGLYHVLSGVLSPMNGIGPEDLHIRELMDRVAAGGIAEIVLATGTSVEGEATAAYLAECLGRYPVNISRIASGVPMGGDLKYVDQVTLKKAMETRHALR